MHRLRAISRPDAHVYLDMIGVLAAHRRQGIATALLEAGHAWADGLGLPVALDTDTEENVAFYTRRGTWPWLGSGYRTRIASSLRCAADRRELDRQPAPLCGTRSAD